MKAAAMALADSSRLGTAQTLARIAQIPFRVRWSDFSHLPGMLGGWTAVRDLNSIPKESFREWWKKRANRSDSQPRKKYCSAFGPR